MNDAEFKAWLVDEVNQNRITADQMKDLVSQKARFDADRNDIERNYQHKVVGYANNKLLVGDTVQELFQKANSSAPGKMIYFEPVGFSF